MNRSGGTKVADKVGTCAGRLARFFPGAIAVRVPVRVTALRPGSARLCETAVLEFTSGEHAIFVSTLPLEFDDRVRVERSRDAGADGKSRKAAEAAVTAVQYHEGSKAVAVRFLSGPCEWVMEP